MPRQVLDDLLSDRWFEGTRFPLDHSNVGYLGVMVRNVPLIAFSLVIG